MPEVVCVVEARNVLGEAPIWNGRENALYWVDGLKPCIQRFEPKTGAVTVWDMPEAIGSMVFRERGGVAAALRSGFCFLDLETGAVEKVANPEPDRPGNRFNDGKCDRGGRYWCATMDEGLTRPTAALYRFDPDRGCHRMDDGFIVGNGIAWSPDDRTMYFADSRADVVYAYDFDLADGRIGNRRVFVSTRDVPGRVDGATVDSEGFYWCALIHDWSIARYDPEGRLTRTIRLPVRHPTMCTFGGERLDVLYVTSTTRFLGPGEAEAQPLAGALFAVHGLGATGLPEPFFAG